jgi:hypothetical protein
MGNAKSPKNWLKTFRQYWAGIVSYFQDRITQGAIEAINGIIQLAKRRARGFRNLLYLRTIAHLNLRLTHAFAPAPARGSLNTSTSY